MTDNVENIENIEATEEELFSVLSNDPSEPIEIPKREVVLVFQRPSMMDKFRQRAWAAKKLRAFGLTDPDLEEPHLAFFFRYWGVLNSYVTRVLVADSTGTIKVKGKNYNEYSFDPRSELDYSSLFEKFVMAEIYDKGKSEEAFVSEVMGIYSKWLEDQVIPKEDDIKNS